MHLDIFIPGRNRCYKSHLNLKKKICKDDLVQITECVRKQYNECLKFLNNYHNLTEKIRHSIPEKK